MITDVPPIHVPISQKMEQMIEQSVNENKKMKGFSRYDLPVPSWHKKGTQFDAALLDLYDHDNECESLDLGTLRHNEHEVSNAMIRNGIFTFDPLHCDVSCIPSTITLYLSSLPKAIKLMRWEHAQEIIETCKNQNYSLNAVDIIFMYNTKRIGHVQLGNALLHPMITRDVILITDEL